MSYFKLVFETLKTWISRAWAFALDLFKTLDRITGWFDSAAIGFTIPLSLFAGGAAVTLIAFVPDMMTSSFNTGSMLDLLTIGLFFGGASLAFALALSTFQMVASIPVEAKERAQALHIVTVCARIVGLYAIIVGLSTFSDALDRVSEAFIDLAEIKAEIR